MSDLPQPEPKRQRRSFQVVVQPAHRFDLCLLHHVGRIDSRPHARVKPQFHEPDQVQPMSFQQPIHGPRLALPDLLQEPLGLRRIPVGRGHVPSPRWKLQKPGKN
ncbi:MAG TPA: hypothetical protein VKI65_13295 [Gemmataceae bacterium]|nr:hypothetical protein [Gemmataceae bacterium]